MTWTGINLNYGIYPFGPKDQIHFARDTSPIYNIIYKPKLLF